MRKPSVQDVKDYAELFWINLRVQSKDFAEYMDVIYRYYANNYQFAKVDSYLVYSYLFTNPFRISKHFLKNKGEKDIYCYGETPLTSLDKIARECKLTSSDTLFELGCGRGRTCFWFNSFIGCKVKGVEIIPEFINRANRIKNKFKISGIEFLQDDMLHTDLTGATAIYLYGTCLEKNFIHRLIDRFSALAPGTKIITVSYPLSDYTSKPLFELMKRFPVKFSWGIADVYLQIKK
jgi:hypothetical protein